MIADADESISRDSRILQNYTMDDIDGNSLKQYRQLFSSSHPDHTWLDLDDHQLLVKLGGYRKDRRTGEEGFTLAGMLMFGKYDSITDIECAPDFFPDFRENLNDELNDNVRWTDRIYPDGTWETNLFQFFRRVYPKLVAILPKPFQLNGAIRVDQSPAHIAVREAFVNTLVHCDYSADGNIVILLNNKTMKFTNPGTLLVSREQYYLGGESVCRNNSLQKMFLMIGGAEKAGSGVSKILKGWEVEKWRKPFINETYKPDKVILEMPMISLFSNEVFTHLKEIFGKRVVSLETKQILALAFCVTETQITNLSMQSIINEHSTDITKLLRNLCRKGFLISTGNGRGTKYQLNVDSNESNVDSNEFNVDSNESNVDSNESNVDSNEFNVDSNEFNVDSNEFNVDSNESKSTRISFEKLELMICEMLEDDFYSIEEIASKINRSVDYLRNNILPRLIDKGSIKRKYPDNPKHPQQKYKTSN